MILNHPGLHPRFRRACAYWMLLTAACLGACAVRTRPDPASVDAGAPDTTEVRQALRPDEPAPAAAAVSDIDDIARYLAGFDGAANSPLAPLRQLPEWTAHATALNELWRRFNSQRRDPINSWAAAELGGLRSTRVLFYPFSGPDFLYANAFFPDAQNTVLCGLESADPLPELTGLTDAERGEALVGIETAVTGCLNFSFFITKDMRADLGRTRLRGVLPILLTFLARANERVESVEPVSLDPAGAAVPRTAGQDPGFRLRCAGGRVVYYFRTNLANGSFAPNGRFATFVRRLGPCVSFTKSASYLLHTNDFSNVRNFMLSWSAAVLQDDSGIPLADFPPDRWSLMFYGRYSGTIDMFKEYDQPALADAHAHGASSLGFGIGYKHTQGQSAMLLARRR